MTDEIEKAVQQFAKSLKDRVSAGFRYSDPSLSENACEWAVNAFRTKLLEAETRGEKRNARNEELLINAGFKEGAEWMKQAAIETAIAELLEGNTGEHEDDVYNQAIYDAVSAIQKLPTEKKEI